MLFYSYLFCVCVLVGVLTHSTVAATLLTLFFWLFVFLMHSTETTLLGLKLGQDSEARSIDSEIRQSESDIAREIGRAGTRPSTRESSRLALFQSQLDGERTRRREFHDQFTWPHQLFYELVTVLPKTTETVELLQRELIQRADLPKSEDDASVPFGNSNSNYTVQVGICKISFAAARSVGLSERRWVLNVSSSDSPPGYFADAIIRMPIRGACR